MGVADEQPADVVARKSEPQKPHRLALPSLPPSS